MFLGLFYTKTEYDWIDMKCEKLSNRLCEKNERIMELEEKIRELERALKEKTPIRQIIDEILYDTSKADYIGEYLIKNGAYPFEVEVYQGRENKTFFYVCLGKVIPLTEQEAKRIIGENDIEKYMKLFDGVFSA